MTRETSLLEPRSWIDGDVWIRTRSGPTIRAHSQAANVTTWHRVGSVGERIRAWCGYGPRYGFLWPDGGLRLEVARPGQYGSLPGDICPRCRRDEPRVAEEIETLVADTDLDDLADAVASRLIERADAKKAKS